MASRVEYLLNAQREDHVRKQVRPLMRLIFKATQRNAVRLSVKTELRHPELAGSFFLSLFLKVEQNGFVATQATECTIRCEGRRDP